MSVASAPPPQLSSVRMTRAEYQALPSGPPFFELIDGRLVEMTRPFRAHDYLLVHLAARLYPHVVDELGGRLSDGPNLYLPDTEDVYHPDLVYLSPAQRYCYKPQGIFGIPEMVCEILSPSTEQTDRGAKLATYARAGIPHVWLIQPRNPFTIEEFVLEEGNQYRLHATTAAPASWTPLLFPGWNLNLAAAEKLALEEELQESACPDQE